MIDESNLNIIIDTDPGTDDALALGVAAFYFKENIRALISSYGNVEGEQTYFNLINLADILKIDCDIIKGSLNPLGKDSFIPTDYHGKNGLCGLVLPHANPRYATRATPFQKGALQNIYDLIKIHKNVKYIAIGPLTNLALLLEIFPDSVDYIDELIIMGGGFEVSNMEHNTEYNFSMDPVALRKILACPVKKVIAPLDMTHQMAFDLQDIEDITGVKRELLSDNMSEPFNVLAKLFYLNYDTAIKHGDPGAIIHDATTLIYLLDKNNNCELKSYKIISDEYGAVSKNSSGYDVFAIEKIDRDYIKDILKRSFYEYK